MDTAISTAVIKAFTVRDIIRLARASVEDQVKMLENAVKDGMPSDAANMTRFMYCSQNKSLLKDIEKWFAEGLVEELEGGANFGVSIEQLKKSHEEVKELLEAFSKKTY